MRATRVLGALCVAGVLAGSWAAHAQAAQTVTLRYHFRTGETFTYRTTSTSTSSLQEWDPVSKSAMVISSTSAVTVTLHYHVLSVDGAGRAAVEVRTSPATIKTTSRGHTTTMTQPAGTYRLVLLPDGRAQGTPGVLIRTMPFPAQSVTPGTHWSGRSTITLPQMPGTAAQTLQLTVRYTFIGEGTTEGLPCAIIDSKAPLQYQTSTSIGGLSAHTAVHEMLTGRTFLGLTVGHVVAQHVHDDVQRITTTGKQDAAHPGIMHTVTDTTTALVK